MATQQPIFFFSDDPPNASGTEYNFINSSGSTYSATAFHRSGKVATGGKFVAMNVRVGAAITTGTWEISLNVNGTKSTTLTGTITSGTTLFVEMDHTISAGDRVTMEITGSGSPTAINRIDGNFIWEPTTDGEYIILGGASNTLHSSNIEHNALTSNGSSWTVAEVQRKTLAPAAGTIKKLAVELESTPGAGSYTFVIEKDGSISTETVVLDSADFDKVNSNDFQTVSAGNDLLIRAAPASSPNSVGSVWGCVYAPTTTTQIPMLGNTNGDRLDLSATEVTTLEGDYGANSWVATGSRSTRQQEIVNIDVDIDLWYYEISSTTGGGGYTFHIEKDGVEQSGLDLAIDGSSVTDNATSTVSFTDGDKWSQKAVPVSTPTSAQRTYWGLVLSYSTAAPSGTARSSIPGVIG